MAGEKAAWETAVGACEVLKYKAFRDAFFAAQTTRGEKLDEIKKLLAEDAATELAALPGSGKAGSRCQKPRSNGDAKGRAACAEGLCCAAASKQVGGALVTVETCQTATDTSFTYVPRRAPMQVDNPPGETWDFTCITGGAQRVLAAAAAAAGLGLMMQ